MKTKPDPSSVALVVRQGIAAAVFLMAGIAVTHCSSSPSGSGAGPTCACGDGSACPGNDATHCADVAVADADVGDTAPASSADAGPGEINVNGPFCVAYGIIENFYSALTPQCTCQDSWKTLTDAEQYVALLDYYPGIYGNAHLVPSCPQLACCIRQAGDGGLVPPGCLCSAATIDCNNDMNNGATTATSCP